MITQEYAKECFTYNPATGVLAWAESRPLHHFKNAQGHNLWNTRFAGKIAGCITPNGYRRVSLCGKLMLVHRIIWLMEHGQLPLHDTDHINGDKSDNRPGNLRAVTRQENQQNAALRSDNTSGHLGVGWVKPANKWQAYISVGGKQKNLGYFTDKDDAIAARAEANITYGFHENHGRPSASTPYMLARCS